jgi:ABC-type multidrug transport system fused ATPase/permease subunit
LLGLLNPSSGEILIDGQIVTNSTSFWQHNIGYVPQNIYLLDDTISKNIAFGEIQTIENLNKINSATIQAQLLDFINSLPEGLETVVGERGVRLSGGQKQRIGIARALYNDPELLVLDEATSALDNNTEKEFMTTLSNLQKNKTIIIIAHRLSTLKKCDIIYKIEAGKIIEFGEPEKFIQ